MEVYCSSVLIREDWLSCFLRFSLPETISSSFLCVRMLTVLGDIYEKEDENDKIFVALPLLLSIAFLSLSSFSVVPDYQIRPLLWRKLRICCTRLDLEDETKKNEIRIRYDTIQELINIVEIGDGDLFCGLGTLEDCFRMFSYVLFRPLSSPQHLELNALDAEVPFLDPDWEFLELTHEFLLKLVLFSLFLSHLLRSLVLRSASIASV